MANKKITELDAITTLASTDVVPVVDVSADTTNKITTTNLFRTLPDGTAAAPALSFASDQDLGLYRTGANGLAISTGGTQRVTVDGSGNVTISGDLTVSGATTTVESTTVTIDDKNIELGSVASPSDTTADGGGITLKGATDKEIKWVNSTGYWTFNTGIDVDSLFVHAASGLGNTAGNSQDLAEFRTANGNSSKLKIIEKRDANGTDWTTAYTRIQKSVDTTNQGYIQFNGSDLNYGIEFGTNSDEKFAQFIRNGAVDLYYDNAKKFATKSDGIDVTGEVQCDSLDVDGTADITGSVTLHGNLDLQDSDKILVGTNDDLQIYHNTGSSFIDNTTAVSLAIRQLSDDADVVLQSDNGSGGVTTYIRCDGSEGEVRLYHYGSEKLNTKSDGIEVTGEVQCNSLDVNGAADITGEVNLHNNLSLQDNDKINFGGGNDLQIYHNGTHSYIKEEGTGELRLGSNNRVRITKHDSETLAVFDADGAVELYYDNTVKLQTKTDGVLVSGELQSNTLDVNGVANIGASDTSDAQLEIGAGATGNRNSYVDLIGDTTYTDYGLRVQRDNGGANGASKILHRGTGDFRFVAQEAAAMEFFTSNVERLRIDSSGRLLLGTTTEGQASADDFTIADSGDVGITIRSTDSSQTQISFSDGTSGTAEYAGQIAYDHTDDHMRFRTAATERLRINSNGAWAIEGASNYGTSGQVLTSNGNDSPTWQDAGSINVGGSSAISMNDSVKINFGASSDLQIFHNGSNSFVETSSSSTGDLFISAQGTNHDLYLQATDDIFIRPQGGQDGIKVFGGGEVELFYNNSKKFDTKSDGCEVIGELECDSLDVDGDVNFDGGAITFSASANTLDFADSVRANFGNGDDLRIFHDGTHSYIHDNGTGNLKVLTDSLVVKNAADSEIMLQATQNGSVDLYYDNDLHFATTSTGVKTNGDLSFRGDGDSEQILFDASDASLKFNDSKKAKFGNGGDLQIYHDGSHTYLDNGAGHLYIRQFQDDGVINFQTDDGSGNTATYIQCSGSNGEVTLHHYGSQKLNTTSSGVNVAGSITCDGLTVDGTFKQSNGNGIVTIQDDNNTGNATVAYVEGRDSSNNQKWFVGHASSGNQDLYINNNAGGQIRFRSSSAERIIMQAAGHLVPHSNNSIDLGSTSQRWRNIYTHDLHLSNEGRSNDVDGTWGNYTIQEGEDDLFLINRRNGKKYKFNLTEVS